MDNDIKIESKKKNRNYKTKMQETKEHNEYNELSKEITVRKQKTKLNFIVSSNIICLITTYIINTLIKYFRQIVIYFNLII